MIGSAVPELTFLAFIENLAVIALINLIVVIIVLIILYHDSLVTTPELKAQLMLLDEKKVLKDPVLLKKCLWILALTILGFFTHQNFHLESSLVALCGAFILLLIGKRDHKFIEKAFAKVEWTTIFFFIGLFAAVGGLIEVGIIEWIAKQGMELTGGDITKSSLLILWASAILSAFLDNIPFVATMIPLIQNMGTMGVTNLEPLWWSLALGACLGGNGTIVGASANLIVAGLAAEAGHKISFIQYIKVGFPIMILTICLSTVYLYFRYLI